MAENPHCSWPTAIDPASFYLRIRGPADQHQGSSLYNLLNRGINPLVPAASFSSHICPTPHSLHQSALVKTTQTRSK